MKIRTLNHASAFQEARLKGHAVRDETCLMRYCSATAFLATDHERHQWLVPVQNLETSTPLLIKWGIVTSRKFGPAVVRNRARRRLKAGLSVILRLCATSNRSEPQVCRNSFMRVNCIFYPRRSFITLPFEDMVKRLQGYLISCAGVLTSPDILCVDKKELHTRL